MVEVKRLSVAIITLALALAPLPSRADAVQNPVTGDPEAVWTNSRTQDQADIVFICLEDGAWPTGTVLSTEGKSQTDPRLIIDPTGTRVAVWETTGGQIALKSSPLSSDVWSGEIRVSDAAESASQPSLAIFDGAAFVGYEGSSADSSGSSHAVVVARIDPGGNVERTLVATSTSPQSLAPRIHAEGNDLWVEWIDSESSLGYAVLGHEGWALDSESYTGPGDLEAGRQRVRDLVLQGR